MSVPNKPAQIRETQLNNEFAPPPVAELGPWFNVLQATLKQDRRTIEDALARLKSGGDDVINLVNAQQETITSLASRIAAMENRSILIRDGNVAVDAAIQETKIALMFPTHDNKNDPTNGQKAALKGTDGNPGESNRYVTNSDPRLVATPNDPNLVEFDFTTAPSTTWEVHHNLGYRPGGVITMNDSREMLIAYVVHVDENTLKVHHTFSAIGYVQVVTN